MNHRSVSCSNRSVRFFATGASVSATMGAPVGGAIGAPVGGLIGASVGG